jgi:hypothetical protein
MGTFKEWLRFLLPDSIPRIDRVLDILVKNIEKPSKSTVGRRG